MRATKVARAEEHGGGEEAVGKVGPEHVGGADVDEVGGQGAGDEDDGEGGEKEEEVVEGAVGSSEDGVGGMWWLTGVFSLDVW